MSQESQLTVPSQEYLLTQSFILASLMKHLQKSHPKGIILALLCITYFFQLIHCKKKKKKSLSFFMRPNMVILGPTSYQPAARSGERDHLFPSEESFLFCFVLFQQPPFLLHIYHVPSSSIHDVIYSAKSIAPPGPGPWPSRN